MARIFLLCYKQKEYEYFQKNNSPFYISVSVICAILVVIIQFFPSLILENAFGKFLGLGSLSTLAIMGLKSILKNALSKTGFIAKILNKLLSPIKKLFKKRRTKK